MLGMTTKLTGGRLRIGRSDMLSPPFKVAADLQATAEQTGFWVSTRGACRSSWHSSPQLDIPRFYRYCNYWMLGTSRLDPLE